MVTVSDMQHRTLTDWALLATLVALWGSNFMFVKIGVATVPPATLAAGRLLVGAVVLIAVIRALGHPFPRPSRTWIPYTLLAVVGNSLPFWLIGWGQQTIDSALAGILMAIMPLATLVMAHVWVTGEHLTRNRALGFLLGFAGIVVLLEPAALAGLGGSGGRVLAQLAVLGGALCYAIQSVLVRVTLKGDVMVASAAIIAMPIVSASRSSPTRITSGSSRSAARSPSAKLVTESPISRCTINDILLWWMNSTGSSSVTMLSLRVQLR